jgi:hypothetical protein
MYFVHLSIAIAFDEVLEFHKRETLCALDMPHKRNLSTRSIHTESDYQSGASIDRVSLDQLAMEFEHWLKRKSGFAKAW